MLHKRSSLLAGKTVRVKAGAVHPQFDQFGGEEFRVEDYWDRVSGGKSWVNSDGNPAAMVYAMRVGMSRNAEVKIPFDDEVLYGKIGQFGHLVHMNEIDLIPEQAPTE